MKRTARIVFVLLTVTFVGSLPLLADNSSDWPEWEMWHDYQIVEVGAFALRYDTEVGPVDLPPWLPAPEESFKVLNLSTSIEVGNGAAANVSIASPLANIGSATQAIPGSRAGSFMSEQRLAERSLRGTIKRLG